MGVQGREGLSKTEGDTGQNQEWENEAVSVQSGTEDE